MCVPYQSLKEFSTMSVIRPSLRFGLWRGEDKSCGLNNYKYSWSMGMKNGGMGISRKIVLGCKDVYDLIGEVEVFF